MTDVYIPGEDDADPDAEAQMHMGKGQDNRLYDPFFTHPAQAQAWLPEDTPGLGEG